jgi:hypothetical protein
MADFDFIQENPVAGAGFVYKSDTDAYYFDGTDIYPIRSTSAFTITTGSGTTTVNISNVASGSVVPGMEITGMSGQSSVVTISIGTPAVISWTAHGLTANTPVVFTTTGDLPDGLFPDVTYYVSSTGLNPNDFRVSLTVGGALINTTGVQSGVHTVTAKVRIVDFGTFDGTSGTVITSLARTFTNPTTVSGYISNNKGATVVLGAGSGTTTLTITSVLAGTVAVGQYMTIEGTSVIITAFGTFDGLSGTVLVDVAPTYTSGVQVIAYAFIVNYPVLTVRGIVYLEGTYYVMTPQGSIYGSNINDPLSWSALNVIQCQSEPDGGVGLIRQLNLIVAFNAYSTEFFYNAGNPTGSPLLPYESAFVEVGCASADSIASTENTVFFLGVTKQKGRSLYMFNGTNPQPMSNAYIDRIFNTDDLVGVSSFVVRIAGHTFYIIYLPSSNVTLAFDSTSGEWAVWSVMLPDDVIVPDSIVWSNGQLTIEGDFASQEDGNVVTLIGTLPSEYAGQHVINKISDSVVTIDYPITAGVITDVGTIQTYSEIPFTLTYYTTGDNLDIVQDSTTGFIYFLDNQLNADNAGPIKVQVRTFKFDAGNNLKKFTSSLELIGDKVDGKAYVRYTNDDYQTYTKYRPVNLAQSRSILNRLGQTRRRAYDIIYYEGTPMRLEALELTLTQGI